MKRNVKTFAALLIIACMLLFMVSCGQSGGGAGGNTSVDSSQGGSNTASNSSKGGEKLSFRLMNWTTGPSFLDTPIHKAWTEMCSKVLGKELDIKYELVHNGEYAEKLKVILAGGDIPDLLMLTSITKAEIDKYGDSGMFVNVADYLDKMPNYKSYLDEDANSKSTCFTPEGKLYACYNAQYASDDIYGFTSYGASMFKNSSLKEYNLEIPTTLEEMYDVAKALKAKGASKYPIAVFEEWQPIEDCVFNGYHTGSDRFYDGKAFQYGPLTEDYKASLMYMNKLYTEGLVSPDYFTHKSDNGKAGVADGSTLIMPNAWEGYAGLFTADYPLEDEWVATPLLVSEKYKEQPWYFTREYREGKILVNSYSNVISAKSKVIGELIALLDYQYSDDMLTLLNWGIEGEHYKVENGKRMSLIGSDMDALAAAGLPPSITVRSGLYPQPQDFDVWMLQCTTIGKYAFGGKVEDTNFPTFASKYVTPENTVPSDALIKFDLSTAEGEEYAKIMTPVTTFAKEERVKFIKGERSFDTWNKYLEELNKMGDIQKAMDIYNNKLK